MRRALFVLSLALIVAVPASQRAAACGNKFLRTGVGILQNHYAPNSSASVLVFARSSSGKASLLGDQNFQAALGRVGHKVVIVHDEASVSRALTTAYDLVLVGYDDRGVIEHAAGAATPAPTLLPVMNKPTKAVMEACKRQYDCRLKTSDRLDEFLKAMDEAMSVRKKAAAGKTR